MGNAPNPFSAASVSNESAVVSQEPQTPFTVLAMLVLSIGLFSVFMSSGPSIIGWMFRQNPDYWFDTLPAGAPDHFKTVPERIQRLDVIAGRYSVVLAAFGFLAGLVLPVVRHLFLMSKHRDSRDV